MIMFKLCSNLYTEIDFNAIWDNKEKTLSSYKGWTTELSYWQPSSHDRRVLLSHLATPKFKIETPQVLLASITGTGNLGAHRDHGTLCCFNWYISTANAVTTFYNVKSDAKSIRYPGKENSNVYVVKDLIEVDSFIAEKDQMWLLDVSRVHAVHNLDGNERRFITYQFKQTPYDIVERAYAQ